MERDCQKKTTTMENENLDSVAKWADQWLLNFVPAKTRSITLSNKYGMQSNPPVVLKEKMSLKNEHLSKPWSHILKCLGERFILMKLVQLYQNCTETWK
jgi:hypothetical protein